MKSNIHLPILVLVVALAFLNGCTALNHSRPAPSFAILTSPPAGGSTPEFRIHGKHPLGMQVRLLEKNSSDSCLAETRSHGKQGVSGVYTELEPLDCRSPGDYSIVILGGVLTSYEVVKGKEIRDARISDMLDERVRSSSVLAGLARKAQDKNLTEGAWSLYEVKPRVLKIQFPGTQLLVAVYDLKDSAGPRAFFFKNRVYPFTGWCSLPFIRAFLLNGTPYFESGSKCCDCGIVIQEIYRVGEEGVELIHAETVESR